MSKLLEIGQECWFFQTGSSGPRLQRGYVEESDRHHWRNPLGGALCLTKYKVQFVAHGTQSTTGWIDGVYATKEEAIASLGGGE